MLDSIFKEFKKQDLKTKTVLKNVFGSAIVKVVNLTSNFLSVPLLLAFIDTTQYGIWLTMSAFLGWFGVFDLGIGNGLRNKLTEALTTNDLVKGRAYVSSAYFALSLIFLILCIVFIFVGYYLINWSDVFNAPQILKEELLFSVLILFGFLCIQFVLKLILTVLTSSHKLAWVDAINAVIQIVLVVLIWQLSKSNFNSEKILVLSIIYSIVPVFILIILSIVLFKTEYNYLKPSIKFVSFSHFKSIGSLGFNFFIIQLCAIIIYAADNMIISHLFAPDQVTVYNIGFRYFSILTIVFSIFLAPFWSMVTAAYFENDINWIKRAIHKIGYIWVLLVFAAILQLILSPVLYKVWVGEKVEIPFVVSLVLAAYVVFYNLGVTFVTFINGTGKIRLQLYISVINVFLNVFLIIFYTQILNIGLVGIPLATLTTILFSVLMNYIQFNKIINNKADGIWNK